MIEWAKARLIAPEQFGESVSLLDRSLPAGVAPDEIAGLYARYEHEKTRRGLIDFDDLLAGCAEAMERDPSFAAAQRWRWRHVFVDEFQDLNQLQFRLLLAWLGPSPDLCAVGDPNQAIYGWNGADAGLPAGVAERWPTTEVVSLDDNHRCTPQIVNAAAAVLGAEGSRLSSSAADGPEPTVRCYPSETAEAQGTALAIRRAHLDGHGWSEMAVLARTNAQLVILRDALAAAGVPVWAPSSEMESAEDEATGQESPDPPARPDPQEADRVTLCSFHRAKGLEWDAVWVVGLESGLVPIVRAGTGNAVDEERRLLYVALTRASRELHCSWARQRTFGGRPIPREPSPWLELIRHQEETSGPEPGDSEMSIEFWRDRLRSQRAALGKRDRTPRGAPRWPDPDPGIVEDLRGWRSQAARASGVPPYVILHDATLSAVASLRPRSHDELVAVPGLGPVKASRYGATLLAIVAKRPVSA
jgi:superfamily I DNA/RNA helicase